MVKHFKNLLSRNRWADFDEFWHEASEIQAHHICSKDKPGLTLTYFTARSNFATYAFIWNEDSDGFFGKYCILWPGIRFHFLGSCSLLFYYYLNSKLNDLMKDYE